MADTIDERMCDQHPECGLSQWSCDRLQDIVYSDDTKFRRDLAVGIRKDMGELVKSLLLRERVDELNNLYNEHNKYFEKDSCDIIKDRIRKLSRLSGEESHE